MLTFCLFSANLFSMAPAQGWHVQVAMRKKKARTRRRRPGPEEAYSPKREYVKQTKKHITILGNSALLSYERIPLFGNKLLLVHSGPGLLPFWVRAFFVRISRSSVLPKNSSIVEEWKSATKTSNMMSPVCRVKTATGTSQERCQIANDPAGHEEAHSCMQDRTSSPAHPRLSRSLSARSACGTCVFHTSAIAVQAAHG